MAGASAPRTWDLRKAGYSLRAPPELRLPRSDPLAYLEQHRERLGAHARAVHGLAPQVRGRLRFAKKRPGTCSRRVGHVHRPVHVRATAQPYQVSAANRRLRGAASSCRRAHVRVGAVSNKPWTMQDTCMSVGWTRPVKW